MGVFLGGELKNETPNEERISFLRHRFPYSFFFIWCYLKIRFAISVIFAPWHSMSDPIDSLLNIPDEEEADKLTAKWTKAKLEELQYVGLTVRISYMGHFQRKIEPYISLECPGHWYHCRSFLVVLCFRQSMDNSCLLVERVAVGINRHKPGDPANDRSQPSVQL